MKYDLIAHIRTKDGVMQLDKPLFVRGNEIVGYTIYVACEDDLNITHNHMDFISGEIKPLKDFIQCQRRRRR